MDTEPRRGSAQIYAFPPGGRAALRKAKPKAANVVVTAPSGRGWYHDMAIRDAGQGKEPEPHG